LTTLSFTLDADPGNEETPMGRTRSLLSIALLTVVALHSVAHATLPTMRVTLHPHLNGGRGWGIEDPGALGLGGATNILASDYSVANKLQALNASLRYTCNVAVVAQPGFEQRVAGRDADYLTIYDLRSCTALAPSCSDGMKNQDEGDVDCGGTICPPCGDFRTCNVGSDCTSGHCAAETSGCPVPGTVCIPAHCFDGVQDDFEWGVDCGDGCPIGCPAGTPCSAGDAYNCTCAAGLYCVRDCDGCPGTCQ